MYLIIKGKKPKPICRECKALHAAKDCPRRRELAQTSRRAGVIGAGLNDEYVDWRAVRQAADEFCARTDAYWQAQEQHVG